MTSLLLPTLLTGYLALAAAFLIAARKLPWSTKWLGVVALAAAAPFFFWLGLFSEQFTSGQCYSRSIGMIADAVENTRDPKALSAKLRSLPLHGYETICSEIETATKALPNGVAP